MEFVQGNNQAEIIEEDQAKIIEEEEIEIKNEEEDVDIEGKGATEIVDDVPEEDGEVAAQLDITEEGEPEHTNIDQDEGENIVEIQDDSEITAFMEMSGIRPGLRKNRRPINSHRNTCAREFNYTNIGNTGCKGRSKTGESILRKWEGRIKGARELWT